MLVACPLQGGTEEPRFCKLVSRSRASLSLPRYASCAEWIGVSPDVVRLKKLCRPEQSCWTSIAISSQTCKWCRRGVTELTIPPDGTAVPGPETRLAAEYISHVGANTQSGCCSAEGQCSQGFLSGKLFFGGPSKKRGHQLSFVPLCRMINGSCKKKTTQTNMLTFTLPGSSACALGLSSVVGKIGLNSKVGLPVHLGGEPLSSPNPGPWLAGQSNPMCLLAEAVSASACLFHQGRPLAKHDMKHGRLRELWSS